MPRFHCFHPENISDQAGELSLVPEESHHLVRVLRASGGDEVCLLNGDGILAEGVLISANPCSALVRVSQVLKRRPEFPRLKLAVGMPKGRTVDKVVRQATELGVSEICFFKCERSEVPKKLLQSTEKLNKWKRIAIEACKQSQNPFLPKLHVGGTLFEWLESLDLSNVHFIGHPQSKVGVPGFRELSKGQETVWLLVGPEGGFTDRELESVLNHDGFQAVNLGTTILRVETACVTMIAMARVLFRSG